MKRQPRVISAVIEELLRVAVNRRIGVAAMNGNDARKVDVVRRIAEATERTPEDVWPNITRVEQGARNTAPFRVPEDLDTWLAAYAETIDTTPWQLWREAIARAEARATPLGGAMEAARDRRRRHIREVAQGPQGSPPTGSR